MTKRTALITGGSRGIGKATAQALQHADFSVLSPGRAEMDLASAESIDRYLSALHQSVDVLVNDAGINHVAVLEKITNEDVRETLDVNLLAPFHLIQALTPSMRAQQFGRIVSISSLWSVVGRVGRANYSMSKAALNAMTRSLAIELGAFNILVNAVAPGYVLTDLTRQNNSEAQLEQIRQTIPLQRLAEPAENSEGVKILCSEQKNYPTRQTNVGDRGHKRRGAVRSKRTYTHTQ